MFGKKKDELKVMYYEGLEGFIQDFPCTITLENDVLVIKKIKPDVTVKLPTNQIISIDAMPEKNFMVQYHNNPGRTAKVGTKFYYVFKYNSSSGKQKHIAFWDVSSKTMNKVLKLREEITNYDVPSEYTL